MKREKQLVKNTLIVVLGKMCTQFISFLLLPLYTAVLSTEEYGIIDLFNTYISLLVPIVTLQIGQAAFRYLIDVRENDTAKVQLLTTVLYTVIVQSILYLIIYGILSPFIKNNYKIFLATNVIATIFSGIMLDISRGLGDNKTYSQGSVISGTGAIILNVFFIVVLKMGANGMLIATFISNILSIGYIFIKKKLYKYFSPKNYKFAILKKICKYSIPLVPNQLSWWFVSVSDRTIISYVLGVSVNGIYSAANKFSSLCSAAFGIFNLTWSESASLHINDEDNSIFFNNIFNVTLKIFVSISLLIIACMPFLFRFFITGSGYADAYYQIPILLISTIFSIVVSLFGSVYIALKKSNEIAKTSFYSAIINIVVNCLLIKYIGLYAASISTFVSFFLMTIYRYFDIQKYIKIRFEKLFIVSTLFITIILLITYYININIISIFSLIIVIVFVIHYNKNLLYHLYKIAKDRLKRDSI